MASAEIHSAGHGATPAEEDEETGLVSGVQGQGASQGQGQDPGPSSSSSNNSSPSQGLMGLPRVVLLMFLVSSSLTLLIGLLIGVGLAPALRPSLLPSLRFSPDATPPGDTLPGAGDNPPLQGGSGTISPSTPAAPGSRQLSFLILGDWGRDGAFNQSIVADSMGRVAGECGCSFVVATGDNFYDSGLLDEDDPQFDSSFSAIYTSPALKRLSWFAVLGNHDYVRNAEAQTGRRLRARDPRWHCGRNYQLLLEPPCPPGNDVCQPLLELFFIDTTPLLLKEWGPGGGREGAQLNFSGLLPDQTTFSRVLLADLREALAASDAQWKAVVGHHPVRSIGVHGDTPELIQLVLPILEEFGVDMFINGHDHCLELIKRSDSPVYFVTSGAGSKAYRELREPRDEEGVQFAYNGQGFVNAKVDHNSFTLSFRDLSGGVLFTDVLNK